MPEADALELVIWASLLKYNGLKKMSRSRRGLLVCNLSKEEAHLVIDKARQPVRGHLA